jgi:hypothetical protein
MSLPNTPGGLETDRGAPVSCPARRDLREKSLACRFAYDVRTHPAVERCPRAAIAGRLIVAQRSWFRLLQFGKKESKNCVYFSLIGKFRACLATNPAIVGGSAVAGDCRKHVLIRNAVNSRRPDIEILVVQSESAQELLIGDSGNSVLTNAKPNGFHLGDFGKEFLIILHPLEGNTARSGTGDIAGDPSECILVLEFLRCKFCDPHVGVPFCDVCEGVLVLQTGNGDVPSLPVFCVLRDFGQQATLACP